MKALQSLLQPPHSSTMEDNKEKTAKWLMLLILFKSLLMALWIGKEYFYTHSYECVVLFRADEGNDTQMKPPRFLRLSEPAGELLPTSQQEPYTQTYDEYNRNKRSLTDLDINKKPTGTQKGQKKWVKKVVRRRKKKLAPSKRTVQLGQQIHSFTQIVPLKSLDAGVIQTKTTQNKAYNLPNVLKKKIRKVKKKKVKVHSSQATDTKRTEKRYLLPSKLDSVEKNPVGINELEILIQKQSSTLSNLSNSQSPLPPTTHKHQFLDQFDAFKLTVVCVGRSLLNVWCLAQFFAAVFFLVGICTRGRCLFIPHLILDALFLVILFIYGITIIVFSFVLFGLVEDMSAETLGTWLVVAAALVLVFAVYTLVFTLTLRCCELLLRKRFTGKNATKNRSKSLLYTQVGNVDTIEEEFDSLT